MRRAISLHTATALAGGLLATFAFAAPAMGQTTQGGSGGQGNAPGAPVGGVSSVSGTGGAGGNAAESYDGAAGGGAGVTGGKGGDAFNGTPGGAGGATAGASGGDGVGGGIGSRASGGGGGAHGAYLPGAPGTAVAGGNGGAGGSSSDGDGGGGGAGGYGAVTTGTGTIFFNNAITGGNGGAGGYGYFFGGSGGDGGIGLLLTGAGSTVSISGAVTGGNGGAAGGFVGPGFSYGGNGNGGIGLVASDVGIVLHATVAGGLNGNGVTRAAALSLGGTNQIALASGWGLLGGVEIAGGSLEFVQGTNQTLSNDIFGTGKLIKSSIGTLTLTGANSYAGGTEIRGGTIVQGSANALGSGGVVLSGGTLDLFAHDLTASRISGSGTITNSAGGALVQTSGTGTFGSNSGAITSNVGIVIDGGATLTLLGNNNLTGGINLAGRLVIGQTGAAGTGQIATTGSVVSYADGVVSAAPILIASNTTQLEVLGTGVATQSGAISETGGSRPLEKIGGGTLILTASNSYTGGTTISAGTLALGQYNSAGGGAITIAGGAALELGVAPFSPPFNTAVSDNMFANALVSTGSGATPAIVRSGYDSMLLDGALSGGDFAFRSIGGTPVNFSLTNVANSHASTSVGSNVTVSVLDTAALGTGTVDVSGGGTLWLQADGYTLANILTGAGNLRISGNTQFASANSMTGDTLYEGGAGALRADNALTSGALIMGANTSLNLNGFNQTVSSLSGNATAVITNATSPAAVSTLTISGTGPDSVFAGTLAEVSPLSGTLALLKNGANRLTLTGVSTYSGGTTITGGLITFANDGNLGTGSVTLDGGGLQWATGTTTDISARLNPLGAGGGVFDTNGNSLTFATSLTGSGGITKAGSGVLTLTGINGYLGDTVVTGGLIDFTTGGLGAGGITLDGGGLRWASGNTSDISDRLNPIGPGGATFDIGATVTFANALTGTGGLTKAGAGTLILAANNSYAGTTTVAGGTLELGSVGALGTNQLTLSDANLVVDTSGTLGNALVVNSGTSGIAAATGTTLTLDGTYSFAANSALRLGDAVNAGTVNFGFSSGSADPSFQLFVAGGTLRATSDGLSAITSTIARAEIASGATLDFNGQVDINGRGGRILNLQGAGRLLNDGENTYLLAGNFAGQIEGSQSITKLGTGTLILTGTNSYSGNTSISVGTLQIGDGTTFGTLGSGTVNNNAILSFSGGALETVTVANNIGGSGALNVLGGTVILTGNNSFSGGLTVAGGTLSLGSNNAAGGAGNMITTTGSVVDYAEGIDSATPITIASDTTQLQVLVGAATQSGAVGEGQPGRGFEKIGAGTLFLTGSNSYSGDTLISAGLINFATDDNLGTGNVTLDGGGLQWASGSSLDISARLNPIGPNGGTFDTNGNDVDLASVVSGAGSVTKVGAGILTLSGVNTYAGGTFVSDDTLALGEDGSAGTGAIALANGTRLLTASCGCDPLTIGNDITIAPGSATIDTDGYETWLTGTISGGTAIFADTFGGGLTVLTGSNTYGDTTIESAAEVQVGDGGTSGTLGTGAVLNDGVLVFDRSDDVTFSQVISGAGMLVQAGYGTLTLAGSNTYTGGTTIDAGTLRVGDGGTAGTLGSGDIVNYGALIFDRSDAVTVGDDITGSGSLTKVNQGTLTLTGFNDYTGTTSIFGGTLAVSGGALFGTNLIELDSGGTLAVSGNMDVSGDIAVLEGGGTIDTGSKIFDVFGGVNFGGMLTKTGSGVLLLEDFAETSGGYGGINVTAGTLALGSNYAAGFGIIWLADGTTLSNASCYCGSLSLDNDIEIATGGTATLNGQGGYIALNGVLSGGSINFIADDGTSSESGSSIFLLNGLNTYDRTIIGPNVAVVLLDGTLGTGDTIFDPTPSDPFTPSALVFANSTDYDYGGAIIGNGLVSVETFDPETKISLSGSNTSGNNFTGTIEVTSGHLNIEGDFGDIDNNSALLTVAGCFCGDATLGGSGTFHGDVEIDTATIAPGSSPGTLTIVGNLTMGAGTVLNYELGAPGTPGGPSNDLVNVGGDLTLDGTLNTFAWGAGYGPGYYRLFNYGGTLTDNGLTIGSIDGALSASLLSNIGGQVNVLLGPQVVQYWDGTDTTGASTAVTGNGGIGIWNAAGTNWTAATGFGINDQWRASVGVFAGAAGGTVTVESTQAFQELRFATDGYLLRPSDAVARLATTGGFSVVDVSAGVTADIGVVIQGGAGLTKTGDGTLLLTAVNAYTGATEVAGGTLRLGINNALTDPTALDVAAGATFDLAGFTTHVGSLSGAGAVTLGGGRLDIGYNNTSTVFSGTMTGPDGGTSTFTKNGSGTLTLSGSIALGDGAGALNSFGQINAGTLQITSTGSISGDLLQNFSTIDNSGTITSFVTFQTFGTATNNASGTIVGNVQNFGTFDNYGTMQGLQSLGGAATNSGTINGNVQSFTSFTSTGIINGSLSNFSTALVQNELNGELGNFQAGATATLTGITTGITNYQGVAGSTLDLANFSTTVGGLNGNGSILIGTGTLTIDSLRPFSDFGGVISGSGALIKTGAGDQTLSGVNTYSGLTTVSGGALLVSLGGSLAGDVQNDATFVNDGTVAGVLTNSGTASNSGTIGGGVTNLLGATFSTTGTVNNGLLNSGTVFAAGTISGSVTNHGSFSLTDVLSGIDGFTQSPAGSLYLEGHALTVGTLAGTGPIGFAGGTLTTGGSGLNSQFDGAMTGPGTLTKNGAGTLTLSGDSSVSLAVNAGTLVLTGSTSADVQNFATVQNDGTVGGGLNNASGATATSIGTISGGVTNRGSFTSTGIVNGHLENAFGTVSLEGQMNGSIDNLAGSLSLTGMTTGIGAVFLSGGSTTALNGFDTTFGSLSGLGALDLGSATLTTGGDDSSTTFSGVISGSGGLTKVGTGEMLLFAVNTYTGLTTISGGSIYMDSGSALAGDVQNEAEFTNWGTVGGLLTTAGTVNNYGTLAGGVVNSGTFSSFGTIGTGVVNHIGGIMSADGQINGTVQNLGAFTVTGLLTGITAFTQQPLGVLDLAGSDLTTGSFSGGGIL